MADRVYIFDTTLRDGEQSPGASMNIEDKLQMAQQLESDLTCRSGAYWCNHRDVLAVFYIDDGETVCTITTGMTHDEAKQAYTEAVAVGGGTIDFVRKIKPNEMH